MYKYITFLLFNNCLLLLLTDSKHILVIIDLNLQQEIDCKHKKCASEVVKASAR